LLIRMPFWFIYINININQKLQFPFCNFSLHLFASKNAKDVKMVAKMDSLSINKMNNKYLLGF